MALWSKVFVLYDGNRILLLCGNVHMNRGPCMHYPCVMCYCPVHWKQKALFLVVYGHIVNVVMSVTWNIQDIKCLIIFLWHCPSFTVETLSFHDCSILTSSDVISVSSEDNTFELSGCPQKCGGLCIVCLNFCSVLLHKE